MRLVPVALALFFRASDEKLLEVWTQTREDDGPFHGLWEFPGGGIEDKEDALTAAVREVDEEVGIKINGSDGKFMGIYPVHFESKTILLNVILFPPYPGLESKGKWLQIKNPILSKIYEGLIPPPNHQIIDDLYRSLYSGAHE